MAIKGSTDTVIHNWAHDANIDHSNPRKSEIVESANCSRDCSGYLWSYSTRIALRLDSDRYLVSSVRYSNTTAKQISMVRRSIPGAYIEVPEIDHRYIEQNPKPLEYNVKHLCNEVIDAAKEVWKHRNEVGGTSENPLPTNNQRWASQRFDSAQLALINYLEWFPVARQFVTLPVKSKTALSKLQASRFYADFDKAKALSKAAAVKAAYATRKSNYDTALNRLELIENSEILQYLFGVFCEPFKLSNFQEIRTKYQKTKKFVAYSQFTLLIKFYDRMQKHLDSISPEVYSLVMSALLRLCSSSKDSLVAYYFGLYSVTQYATRKQWQDKLSYAAYLLENSAIVDDRPAIDFTFPEIPAELIEEIRVLPLKFKRVTKDSPTTDLFDYFNLLELATKVNALFRSEFDRVCEIRRNQRAEAEALEFERRNQRRKEEELARTRSNQHNLDEWLAGRSNYFPQALRGYNDKIYLRLAPQSNDVETSLGASVPVKLARYVWPKLLAYRSGLINSSSLPGQWGIYRFDPTRQPEDRAYLQIGCHMLEWNEVEKIATLLGLAFDVLDVSDEVSPPLEISTNG